MAERLEIAQPRRVRTDGALERAAGALVQLAAPGQQQVLVDHFVHKRVREPVARCPRGPARAPGSGRTRRGASSAASAARRVRRDGIAAATSSNTIPSTAASCSSRRASAGSRSTRERSSPCSVGGMFTASQAAVHVQRSPSRTSTPVLTRLRTISSTNSGLPPARVATKFWTGAKRRLIHRAEQAAHQRLDLVRGERREPDDALRSPRDERRGRVGAMRDQHHQAAGPRSGRRCPAAGPPRPRRPSADPPRRAASGPAARRRSTSVRAASAIWRLSCSGSKSRGRRLLDPEQVAQHRHDGLCDLGRRSERAEACRQLLPRDIERVVGLHLVGLAEERREDAVGGLAQGRAVGPADGRAGEPALVLEPPQELGDQPRLARARLAHEAHDLRPATLHRARRRRGAARAPRCARPSATASPCAASPRADRGSASAPSRRWTTIGSGLAAQRQFAGRLEGEAMPGERMGGLRTPGSFPAAAAQQARGRVHGVARHVVGRARRVAEAAGHDRAGVNARCAGSPAGRAAPPTARSAQRCGPACRARRRAPARDRPRARPARRTTPARHRRGTSRRSRRSGRSPGRAISNSAF